jgi:hypothetical protein
MGFLLLVACLLCGFAGELAASARGLRRWAGFLLGFLLGPIGILVILAFPIDWGALRSRDPTYRRCPECAEFVRLEARRCRYCGSNLPAVSRGR